MSREKAKVFYLELYKKRKLAAKKAAKEKVAALLGREVTMSTKSNGSMKWKVVETYEPPEENILPEVEVLQQYGMKDFNTSDYMRSEVLVHLFLQLTFIDWKEKVTKMNTAVAAEKCKCRKFSAEEFLIGLALIIGAAEFSQKGVICLVLETK